MKLTIYIFSVIVTLVLYIIAKVYTNRLIKDKISDSAIIKKERSKISEGISGIINGLFMGIGSFVLDKYKDNEYIPTWFPFLVAFISIGLAVTCFYYILVVVKRLNRMPDLIEKTSINKEVTH